MKTSTSPTKYEDQAASLSRKGKLELVDQKISEFESMFIEHQQKLEQLHKDTEPLKPLQQRVRDLQATKLDLDALQ